MKCTCGWPQGHACSCPSSGCYKRAERLRVLLRRWHNEHPKNKRQYDLWCDTGNELGEELPDGS